jgi:ribosomal protein S18 acetylase RimI-like enzyme
VWRAQLSGLGRTLVTAACETARARGCRRIELDVSEANAPALALYQAAGFRTGKLPGGRDVFMGRRLDNDAP